MARVIRLPSFLWILLPPDTNAFILLYEMWETGAKIRFKYTHISAIGNMGVNKIRDQSAQTKKSFSAKNGCQCQPTPTDFAVHLIRNQKCVFWHQNCYSEVCQCQQMLAVPTPWIKHVFPLMFTNHQNNNNNNKVWPQGVGWLMWMMLGPQS